MDQSALRQRHNIGNVPIRKSAAHCQHCADALEKYSAPIRLYAGGGGHDCF
jgi:hypothetical protein